MMFYNGNWSGWGEAGMVLAMVIFWALIIWAVYVFVTGANRRHVIHHHGDTAGRILDERLARGDIDADEYERLTEVLAARNSHDHSDSGGRR